MTGMRWFVYIVVFVVGCGSILPPKTLYDSEHPAKLISCPAAEIQDIRQQSVIAIQATLADVEWVIEKRDLNQFVVIGKKCKFMANVPADPLVRTDPYCVSMIFKVEENGDIFIFRVKNKEVKRIALYELEIWMSVLSRKFSELRCYSEDKLAQRVAR